MQIEAIPMLINSDFMNVPLDKLLHLMDYKMHGEDSYVFQQKELLHGLYECTYLSMNDRELVVEAFVYLIENNKHIGKAFGDVYGIGRKDTLSTLSTMQAVAASSTAMQAVANSSTAIQALSKSSLRVKLTYGKKVENGLMLIMSTGPSTYFAKDFNNVQTSYIKFTDGTVYPSQDGYKGSPTFGSFFKEHPKSAFFARTYYQFNDCYMDLILIRGTIVNAQ